MLIKRMYFCMCVITFYYVITSLFGFCRQQANINKTQLLKIPYSEVYIYSAVAVFVHHSFDAAEDSKQKRRFNAIAISAFEIGNDSASTFRCCYLYQNRTVTSLISSSRSIFLPKAIRRAIQLICPLNQSPYDIRGVSIMLKNTVCSKEEKLYTNIAVPESPIKKNKSEKSIGVCLKVAYGDLHSSMLVEWLEALQLLGVDRVFAHLHKLCTSARTIFQFYVKTGFVEAVEFELPINGLQTEIDTNDRQGWSDEQVALFNCQARLLMYDYVIVIDTDEFLLARAGILENSWQRLFNEIFQNPMVAASHFWTVLHMTSWEPTNPRHPLFIGKYNNCTVPLIDREKLVYIPTKVEFGSVLTHSVKPFRPYKRISVEPERAVVHHYRHCREEWLRPRSNSTKSNWIKGMNLQFMDQMDDIYYFNLKEKLYCYDFRRNYSKEIDSLSKAIKETKVLEIIRGTVTA